MIGSRWQASLAGIAVVLAGTGVARGQGVSWNPDDVDGRVVDVCDDPKITVSVNWDPADPPTFISAHIDNVEVANNSNLGNCSKGNGSGSCEITIPSDRCTVSVQIELHECPDADDRWSEPAHVYIACGSSGPACFPSAPCEEQQAAGQCVASPIDVATGNVWYVAQDTTATAGDVRLDSWRRYDSEARDRVGYLGRGFRHSFEETLECAPAWNNRQTCVYNNAGGDRWNCLAYKFKDQGSVLTAWSCDGPIDLLANTTDGPATIVERDGTSKTFEHVIFGELDGLLLTQIADRRGNAAGLFYHDGSAPYIDVIHGALGVHQLVFEATTTSRRRLDKIVLPDASEIDFTVASGTEHLLQVTRSVGPLSPGVSQVTTYEWETDPNNSPHLLRTVKDGAGHVIESWTYDVPGRGISFSREGGVDAVGPIEYGPTTTLVRYPDVVNPLSPTPETITPALFVVDRARKRVTSRTGLCAECPGRVERKRTIEWDPHRPLIRTILDGEDRRVEYLREVSRDGTRKFNVRSVQEATGPIARQTEICYDAIQNVPVLIETRTVGTCAPPELTVGSEAAPCHLEAIEGDHATIYRKLNAVGDIVDEEVRGCRGGQPFTKTRHIGYDAQYRLETIGSARLPEVTRPITFLYSGASRKPTSVSIPVDGVAANDLVWGFGYDGMGRVTSVLDPNGSTAQLQFDALGNLREEIRNFGLGSEELRTSYTYDYAHDGVLATLRRPQQSFASPARAWSFWYDGAHRLTELRDPQDPADPLARIAVTRSIRDSRSRLRRSELLETVNQVSAVKWFNEYDWDELGRMVVRRFVTTPLGGTATIRQEYFSWDGTGRLLSHQDAAGDVALHDHDDLGRLRLLRQFDPLGKLIAEHEFGYDSRDDLTRITPPNRLPMKFEYGDDGLLAATDLFDAGRSSFGYDLEGNLTAATDARGILVTRTWDWAGRLTGIVHPDPSEDVRFYYDESIAAGCHGKGRLTSMTDPTNPTFASRVLFCYDRAGRLLWEARPGSGFGTTSFTWDKNDNLTQVAYPFTNASHGRRTIFDHDDADRVKEVRVWYGGAERKIASEIEHLPFGPVRKLKLFDPAAQVVRERQFDTSYRLLRDKVTFTPPVGNPVDFFHRDHGYDAHGFLSDVESPVRPSSNRHFGYDGQHQLTIANAPGPGMWGAGGYQYDEAGNRKQRTLGTSVLQLVYGDTRRKNRVTAVMDPSGGALNLGYDLRGNVTNYGSSTFTYTGDGQMKSVQHGTTSFATYLYDGDARVRQIQQPPGWPQPAEIVALNYINGHELLEEVRQPGKTPPVAWLAQSYVWLDGEPLARVDSRPGAEELYVYLTDHLGTPVEMLKDGFPTQPPASTWAAELEAFGELYPEPAVPLAPLPEQDNRLRFLGQRYDDTGSRLYQNWHRDYDPRLGRYRQPDMIVDHSASPYAYARNHVTALLDPEGLAVRVRNGRLRHALDRLRRNQAVRDILAPFDCPYPICPDIDIDFGDPGVDRAGERRAGVTDPEFECIDEPEEWRIGVALTVDAADIPAWMYPHTGSLLADARLTRVVVTLVGNLSDSDLAKVIVHELDHVRTAQQTPVKYLQETAGDRHFAPGTTRLVPWRRRPEEERANAFVNTVLP